MSTEYASFYINLISLSVVLICWCVFAWAVLFGRERHTSRNERSAPSSWVGLTLQLAGIGITFVGPRSPVSSPFIAGQYSLNIALQIVAIILAAGSVWIAILAIRELGKQWSLEARVLEGHKLITTGIYSTVRHPIYTAMLGMLLATGLAWSHWIAVILGLVVFLVGTKIRTRLEEALLRDAFGEEFEEWRGQVPGLIPYLWLT